MIIQQGWRNDKSARLPPMWPGFDSGPVPYVGLSFGGLSLLLVPSLLRVFFSEFFGFPGCVPCTRRDRLVDSCSKWAE